MHLAALVKIGIRKFGVDVCIHVALCYGGGALGGKMRLPPLESCNGLLQHHRPEGRVRLGRACVNNCFIIPFAAGGGAMCERACMKNFPASMHIHAQKNERVKFIGDNNIASRLYGAPRACVTCAFAVQGNSKASRTTLLGTLLGMSVWLNAYLWIAASV